MEGFRSLPINQFVSIAVAGDLMSLVSNLMHQGRAPLSNPAKDEKSSFRALVIKQSQDTSRVLYNPEIAGIPLIRLYGSFQVFYLKPVFDIETEGVQNVHI